MTLATASLARRAPGRIWYVVAILLFLAGAAGMGGWMYREFSGLAAATIYVVVPGSAELTLDRPGTYTIFHEYRSQIGDRTFTVDRVHDLYVSVRAKATGQDVALANQSGSSYAMSSHAGRSLFEFKISDPGTYLLTARYGDGRQEPQTVLTVVPDFLFTLLVAIIGGVVSLLCGVGGAVTMIVTVAKRRRAAQQAGILN